MARRVALRSLWILPFLLLGPEPTDLRQPLSPAFALPTGVAERIAALEYAASATPHGVQAPNRAHHFRAWFEPEGVRIVARSAGAQEPGFRLRASTLGRADALAPLGAGDLAYDSARVEIARPGLVEWYLNSPAGLEHGFRLAARPAGAGELVLTLSLDGATARPAGDDLWLCADDGEHYAYSHLVVRDAEERELVSRL